MTAESGDYIRNQVVQALQFAMDHTEACDYKPLGRDHGDFLPEVTAGEE